MRLAICAYPLSKGKETGRGLDRVVDEFCNCLDRNHIPFDFYASKVMGDLQGSASFRKECQSVLRGVEYLRRLQSTTNPIYLATYPVASIFPAFLKKRPLVTLIHDLIPFLVFGYDSRFKYSIKRWSIRYSCSRSDRLIVPFQSHKLKLIELFGTDPDKIHVVPYGVNHESYYRDRKAGKIHRSVAFLGETKRAKGLDTLIRAFRIVLGQTPEARLLVAGNGNESDRMKRLAHDTLPASSFQFLGFIAENRMREFYNSAELFAFPSRYGFGLSALESMACGTPAIVGATLDATDFIDDRDLLVDPEDFSSLAGKIIALLTNQDLYRQKCEYAVRTAAKYSWEGMSGRYYDICREVSVPNSG